MKDDDSLQLAICRLGALRFTRTEYLYYDELRKEDCDWFVVNRSELMQLGATLQQGRPDAIAVWRTNSPTRRARQHPQLQRIRVILLHWAAQRGGE
jgi:hypothetical protein